MKFLIDVCVGVYIEQRLIRHFSDDFLCVRDINPRMEDSEILKLARSQQRIIITSDKDFGDLIFLKNLEHSGVLLLRFDELNFEEKAEKLITILTDFRSQLINHFSVYQSDKIRIR